MTRVASVGRFLLVTLSIAGCSARAVRPATAPGRGGGLERLRAELTSTFDGSSVNALWAVKVQSLESGEVLYEQNAHRLVMPGSNVKIVTMAVAAEKLGWDYRFPTTIETDRGIADGTIGDLVIVGHGDPSINERVTGDRTRVFTQWADRLLALGIKRISGRIVGDDDAFDDVALGEGWSWTDLSEEYAAPPTALQFNENVTTLRIRARGEPGQPADIEMTPADGLTLADHVTVAPASTPAKVVVFRRPSDPTLIVEGVVPKNSDHRRAFTVSNPTAFFVSALRATLVSKGIAVEGPAVDIDDIAPKHDAKASAAPGQRRVLFTHQSPPLSEIAVPFMKASQNLYGETLLSAIGIQAGLEPCPVNMVKGCRGRAVKAARKVYEQVLESWGVPQNEFIISDGSGLSRYNYLTADLLVTVLRRMARDPRHAAPFDTTLSIMGKDGTLSQRLRGTRAEGTVHAKSGSMANVRALSGYLTTADGERLVFSIVGNNFKAPSATVDAITDRAVERLVQFKR